MKSLSLPEQLGHKIGHNFKELLQLMVLRRLNQAHCVKFVTIISHLTVINPEAERSRVSYQ